jgi:hypothetical protein
MITHHVDLAPRRAIIAKKHSANRSKVLLDVDKDDARPECCGIFHLGVDRFPCRCRFQKQVTLRNQTLRFSAMVASRSRP